jgi:flagellar protein FliO/FliZ
MSGGIVPLLTASGALLVVLALIAGGARLLSARGWSGRSRSGTRLAVHESLALDPKRRLHLVQCGNRQVVLMTGGAQDVVVGWIEPSPIEPSGIEPSGVEPSRIQTGP